MKSKFLFPRWCASLGWMLSLPGFVLGYFVVFNNYEIPGFGFKLRSKSNLFQGTFENFTNELSTVLVLGGLLLIAFSKSKIEDELNAKLRLNSLSWSILIYFIGYNLCLILINIIEIPVLSEHILVLNLFSPLLVFILRFNFLKRLNQKDFKPANLKLLANRPYRKIGIILSLIGFAYLFPTMIKDPIFGTSDILFGVSYCITICGLLLLAYSKNKIEDEGTTQLRLENWQQAIYINYGVILIATILLYAVHYLIIMMFAQCSLLLYFVVRMGYQNYRNRKIMDKFEGRIAS